MKKTLTHPAGTRMVSITGSLAEKGIAMVDNAVSIRKIVVALPRFVWSSLRALAHPERQEDFRFATAFFGVPVMLLAGLLLIGWLLPSGWDWFVVLILCGLLAGGGYPVFIEGDGFERLDDWIEGRESIDVEGAAAMLADQTMAAADAVGYRGDPVELLFRSLEKHEHEFSPFEQEKMVQIVEMAARIIWKVNYG